MPIRRSKIIQLKYKVHLKELNFEIKTSQLRHQKDFEKPKEKEEKLGNRL